MKTYNNPFSMAIDTFLNQDLSDVFGVDVLKSKPSVNIKETTDKHILELAVPGVDKESIDVSIEKNSLVIKTIEKEVEKNEEEKVFKHREFNFAKFERRFSLPDAADVNKIEAKYDAGILIVSISKKEEAVDNGPISVEVL